MMVVKGEQWAPNTHSGVWTCDEVSLKKSSLGRRICHTHKIPRTLVLLVPEVSIQVLGFARPCPIKLSHLMKEVHGVCISSLLQSCSLPHGPHPVGSLPEGLTEWGGFASFHLGQFHFCGNLPSFGMVFFSLLLFSFVPALFQQTSQCRKSSLGNSVRYRPYGRNLCSASDPCGML